MGGHSRTHQPFGSEAQRGCLKPSGHVLPVWGLRGRTARFSNLCRLASAVPRQAVLITLSQHPPGEVSKSFI